MAVYWFVFFWNLGSGSYAACFKVFEQAFPPADAALAVSAVQCAEALRRRRATAVLWGLFAAGNFCFLGVLGATYNLQHGGYRLSPSGVGELVVNMYCLGLAAWLSVFLWRERRALGA
jgi:hypothetical protein